MSSERIADGQDSSLLPFLDAGVDSPEEEAALQILIDQVTPVIDGVMRGRLFLQTGSLEREEVLSEVILRLIKRLREVKTDPHLSPISNFGGYAAVTTFNVIHASIRRTYPERQRLRNRVRHVLRGASRYALWENQTGELLCGLAAWSRSAGQSSEAALAAVPSVEPLQGVRADNITRQVIERLLTHLFNHVQQPVELERVIETFAQWLRLPVTAGVAATSERVDPTASAESSVVLRSVLGKVWSELAELPVKQRIALLLGLRDGNGSGIMSLLVLLRVVTLPGLADAVGMTAAELAGIWDQLPFDDMTIAGRLGATRQQIINLRKSGRERLERRLGFLRDGNPLFP